MKPTIEIHIITYNEEIMLPFTIAHYRKLFGKNCKIIIHDNFSTDSTVQIAINNHCDVIGFKTDGLSDSAYTKIKSEAHLTANSDWCLCVDCDELCYINNEDLVDLNNKGINIVKFQGWSVFDNVESPFSITEIKGSIDNGYSKAMLVKVGCFKELLYVAGCHNIEKLIAVEGCVVSISENAYKLLHYKHWNINHVVSRSAMFSKRMSEENKKNGWGFHYNFPAQTHIDYMNEGIKNAQLIVDKRI